MKASHTGGCVTPSFDDRNVVSYAGLLPAMWLVHAAGLGELARQIQLGPSPGRRAAGANPDAKVCTAVAGMIVGADWIQEMDVLRHGGLPRLFADTRSASTVGTFLRFFSIGHAQQLRRIAGQVLENLAALTPLLPEPATGQAAGDCRDAAGDCRDAAGDAVGDAAGGVAFVDVDSKISPVFGVKKEGARYGHTHQLGLNVLAATLTVARRAPLVLSTVLRSGNADTRKNATQFAVPALRQAKKLAGRRRLVARLDSGYYVGELIKAITGEGAEFSVTAPQRESVMAAVADIADETWCPLRPSRAQRSRRAAKKRGKGGRNGKGSAVPLHQRKPGKPRRGQKLGVVEIAETTYTAFRNPTRNPGGPITARLIILRQRQYTRGAQGELFPVWRYHIIFTNRTGDMHTLAHDHDDRGGAIEQVFADMVAGPLAHLPFGSFWANDAWLTLAGLTHNVLRAIGAAAGGRHTTARTATIRRQLIQVAGRASHSARRVKLRLPQDWPWAQPWTNFFTTTQTT